MWFCPPFLLLRNSISNLSTFLVCLTCNTSQSSFLLHVNLNFTRTTHTYIRWFALSFFIITLKPLLCFPPLFFVVQLFFATIFHSCKTISIISLQSLETSQRPPIGQFLLSNVFLFFQVLVVSFLLNLLFSITRFVFIFRFSTISTCALCIPKNIQISDQSIAFH